MPIWMRQAAAIPVRDGRICLVTSSSGRRWVVPKGQIDPGHTPGEAALVEAWEEAGLVGALDSEPLGSYSYEKLGRELHVLVYRMTVTDVRDTWPERNLRTRAWVTLDEALDRIEEPGLRDLLRLVFRVKAATRPTLASA
ncbi:NUDIX domain protein [Gemmata sp. SH-PL17]|uniref:NUDIX hydrolase n=1 Tax=Gemmata sp. SH-PL17 TaxID=1630693 RepID=UPI00078BEEB3|nr:NUDIX hydrolase [Gemmata sp. SH-PL17]AMV27839.1 NUDIX domain protein [Gemmata sp. SH-PL17]